MSLPDIQCPGAGNYPAPNRAETSMLFGLIRRVTLECPETFTTSSWEEYSGPPSKFLLWIAIVLGTTHYPNGSYAGILVNGEWAWWDLQTGFYGVGIKKLASVD